MADPYAPPAANDAPAEGREPSPGWAGVMSLIVPGVGQVYVGSTVRGIVVYAGQSLAIVAMVGLAVHSPWLLLCGVPLVWVLFGIGAALDARALARRSTRARGPVVVVIAAFLFILAGRVSGLATRAVLVEVANVPSAGMRPTLLEGDHVVIRKNAGLAERGEVVLFEYPENRNANFLQRVVGLPGETVRIEGRDVFLNGEAVPKCEVGAWQDVVIFVEWLAGRPHLITHAEDSPIVSQTWMVAPHSYFVIGDNRDASHDSRYWSGGKGRGVPEDHLLGRLTGIWFSTASPNSFARVGIDVEGASLPPGAGALRPALERCLRSVPPV